MNKTTLSRLEKKISKAKNLEGAIAALTDVMGTQEKDNEDNELWELRLRAMRGVGLLLPPKHTHRKAAESALDRRRAYKCRLLGGVSESRFERTLKEFRKGGKRPRVQSMLRWARKDRGEDPQLLLAKAKRSLQDLRDGLARSAGNDKSFKSIDSALGNVDLKPKKGKAAPKKAAATKKPAKKATKKKPAKKKPAKKAAKKKAAKRRR
ncbi:MAG: hypothetical protein JKY65_22460 [Planctomycetes bacterium]|nr:hypothetical protein [Planctomycetota bacterium]